MRFNQFDILRDNERARIARIVRESEAGWIVYDHRGNALSVDERDAVLIEAEAVRRLDRYLAALRRMPLRVFGVAAFALFADTVMGAALPALSNFVRPILIGLFVTYFIFEASSDLRYRLADRRWRARLARDHAGIWAVPADVAAHHRRYNLLRIASQACALATLAVLAANVWRGDMERAFDPLAIGLFVLSALLWLPANRVDVTHRRRKWL